MTDDIADDFGEDPYVPGEAEQEDAVDEFDEDFGTTPPRDILLASLVHGRSVPVAARDASVDLAEVRRLLTAPEGGWLGTHGEVSTVLHATLDDVTRRAYDALTFEETTGDRAALLGVIVAVAELRLTLATRDIDPHYLTEGE